MWINNFKVAIATKNAEKIDKLVASMPEFEKLEEMEEVFHLMNQARTILESLKDETLKDMNKVKSNIHYLKSATNIKKNNMRISFNV